MSTARCVLALLLFASLLAAAQAVGRERPAASVFLLFHLSTSEADRTRELEKKAADLDRRTEELKTMNGTDQEKNDAPTRSTRSAGSWPNSSPATEAPAPDRPPRPRRFTGMTGRGTMTHGTPGARSMPSLFSTPGCSSTWRRRSRGAGQAAPAAAADGSEQSFQWDAARRPDPGHGHRARPFRSALRRPPSLSPSGRGGKRPRRAAARRRPSTRATPGDEGARDPPRRSLARPLDRLCSADGLPAHPVETGAPSRHPPGSLRRGRPLVCQRRPSAPRGPDGKSGGLPGALLAAPLRSRHPAHPRSCMDADQPARSARPLSRRRPATSVAQPYFYVTPGPTRRVPPSPLLPVAAAGTPRVAGRGVEARAFVAAADQEGQVRDSSNPRSPPPGA